MAKPVPRIFSSLLCLLALLCVASVHAAGPKTAKADKARPKPHAAQSATVTPPAAVSPEVQLARKYSPIQYCHGASYPAVSWMQVRDFEDKHSPPDDVSSTVAKAKPRATDPTLATIPKLEYPESMVASGLDGAVAVMVAVTREGLPSDELVVCSNHPAFSEAALVAVKAATFVAATRDGQAIESVVTLPIDFHP